jgi:transcriptional regulator with XRE-family HTH domain
LTQAGLARASGLSLGAIRDYEQGNRGPTLKSAVMLTKALGVSVEAFAEAADQAPDPAKPRGRPPKAAGPAPESAPKKPRGKKGQ